MINVVVPMAGLGSRFSKVGYTLPKPFIDVAGKPMIQCVLENLNVRDARYILMARAEHLRDHKNYFDALAKKFTLEVIAIEKLTLGPACTILGAHDLINNDAPLLTANSDQLVEMDFNDYIGDCTRRGLDGSILTFPQTNDPKWSYAKTDANGLLLEAREKVEISDQATVGIYYFNRGRDFVNAALDMIVANDATNGEFYVSHAYNHGIRHGKKFGIYPVRKEQMHGLGVPEDLDAYLRLLQTRQKASA